MSTGDLFEPEPPRVTGQPRYMCKGVECVKSRPRVGSYCSRCLLIRYCVSVCRSTGEWPKDAPGDVVQHCIDLVNRGKI